MENELGNYDFAQSSYPDYQNEEYNLLTYEIQQELNHCPFISLSTTLSVCTNKWLTLSLIWNCKILSKQLF